MSTNQFKLFSPAYKGTGESSGNGISRPWTENDYVEIPGENDILLDFNETAKNHPKNQLYMGQLNGTKFAVQVETLRHCRRVVDEFNRRGGRFLAYDKVTWFPIALDKAVEVTSIVHNLQAFHSVRGDVIGKKAEMIIRQKIQEESTSTGE